MARLGSILGLLLALLVAACGSAAPVQGKNGMESYTWWPTESAPREAPAFLISGDLPLLDGEATYVPDQRLVKNGWGAIGSTHLVGEDRKPLPSSVALRWFSYVEDRFYAGEFPLPADRMAALFRTPPHLPPGVRPAPYDRILFGVAPGGHVSVWLGGNAMPVVTLVASFRAAPATIPWSEVIDNPEISRADHVRRTLASAGLPDDKWLPVPPEAWDDFQRRLAWSPRLKTAGAGAILWMRGLDGENNWFDLEQPDRGGFAPGAPLPMPRTLTLSWRSPAGVRRAEIALDPVEVLAAFRKLATAPGDEPLVLLLEPADTGQAVDLFLQRGRLLYHFERQRVTLSGGD